MARIGHRLLALLGKGKHAVGQIAPLGQSTMLLMRLPRRLHRGTSIAFARASSKGELDLHPVLINRAGFKPGIGKMREVGRIRKFLSLEGHARIPTVAMTALADDRRIEIAGCVDLDPRLARSDLHDTSRIRIMQ